MSRVVLSLLVLVNLLLVCQGHEDGGHHTDYHLTFLGEPPGANASSSFHGTVDHDRAEHAASCSVVSAEAEQDHFVGPVSPGAATAYFVTSAPEEGHAVTTLTVDFGGQAASVSPQALFPGDIAPPDLLPQVVFAPLDPPPRLSYRPV